MVISNSIKEKKVGFSVMAAMFVVLGVSLSAVGTEGARHSLRDKDSYNRSDSFRHHTKVDAARGGTDAALRLDRELQSYISEQIADEYIALNAADLGLTESDIANKRVVNKYTTEHNGVTHIYYTQTINGIDVTNGVMNINVDTKGNVIGSVGSSFVNDAQGKAENTFYELTVTAMDAIMCAMAYFGIDESNVPPMPIANASGPSQEFSYDEAEISRDNVKARLVYYSLKQTDEVKLAWELTLYTVDQTFGGNVWVDTAAPDCSILDTSNWISGAQYEVYALPKESPNDGGRTIVVEAVLADPVASPFGWHDTDGIPGAEHTITRGNNVCAQLDRDANNSGCGTESPPDGGAGLDFTGTLVPLDLLTQDPVEYGNAAVVNLFVWNNIMHDILYRYGFDEKSGNFQQNNYGKGGIDGDGVIADAQDGQDVNNAFFYTPRDGESPRMTMHVFPSSQANTPSRDSDLDNGIIAHEYCHGLSTRLTGGASNSNCLSGKQQAGEGWSDLCALFVTASDSDTRDTPRGIGTYVKFQAPDGQGFRPTQYTTNMEINNFTYGKIADDNLISVPHGVGFVWATANWEVYWNMVDKYGFDSNLHHGNGGNNRYFQLMVDGLKFQKCNPTFLDARDAIIAADNANNGGVNVCLIWKGFAKRGMGINANDGGDSSSLDVTEDFDVPPECLMPTNAPSSSPSKQPSSPPSKQPTLSPSKVTSSSPSKQPTSFPSKTPSSSPLKQPSSRPSLKQPTLSPSKAASSSPMKQPSSRPSSKQPSSSTTAAPTTAPTASKSGKRSGKSKKSGKSFIELV